MTIKVGMISLGCSKNQVDAERLLAKLAKEGFAICNDMTECDAVIVNTCGFIEDAKRSPSIRYWSAAPPRARGTSSVWRSPAAWRSATARSWPGRSPKRMWYWASAVMKNRGSHHESSKGRTLYCLRREGVPFDGGGTDAGQ